MCFIVFGATQRIFPKIMRNLPEISAAGGAIRVLRSHPARQVGGRLSEFERLIESGWVKRKRGQPGDDGWGVGQQAFCGKDTR